jgi:hypothetical protein
MTELIAAVPEVGAKLAPASAPEPTLTVSELRGLLQDATALAAAQRPIVLHPAAEPATAAHPGVTVTYPATTVEQAPPAPSRRLYTRPEVVFAAGVTSAISTLAAGIASAVTASPAPLAIAAVVGIGASVGAAVVMTGDDDRAQLRAWRERRGGGAR